ncbi:hypothetical protein [Roseivirga sp.]|uniref:hypothetical protein n=1 Tax=Roseivirga sp. TaxID=1964215 RepID=UPI003B8D823A
MKSIDSSSLFEKAKQVPTELSKETVFEFIGTIPSLPAPANNWFQNFNLNSIIMTTTAITLVTSAVIYFTSFTGQENTPVLQNVPEVILKQTITDSIDKKEPIIKPIPQTVQLDDPQGEKAVQQQKKASLNTTSEKVAKVPKEEEETTTKIGSLIPTGNHLDAGKAVQFEAYSSVSKISLTGTQLRKLKSDLIKYVKADDLNRGRSNLIIVEFNRQKPKINHYTLNPSQIQRYEGLLKKYNIDYGPQRRIVVDKKYIMVGDFTEEGFSGSALGKAMDIQFKGYDKPDLFSNDKNSDIPSIKSDTLRLSRQISLSPIDEPKRTGGTIFQPYQPERDSPSIKGEYEMNFYQARKVSLLDKDGVKKKNILSRKDLKRLRRDIYSVLYKSNLIESKKADIRIGLNPNELTVNKDGISQNTDAKLREVFLKYSVALGTKMKLLMNNDFIMIGEFNENKFKGSVTGTINSKEAKSGVFMEDLKEISLFKFGSKSKKNDN